jgi:hypothetical protein
MDMSSKTFSIQNKNTDPCLAKKNLQSFNHVEEPQKKQHYKIAKADTATIKHSNVSYFQIAKRANTGSKTAAPKLVWKRIDHALAVPHALREISQQSDGTRTHALTLCVRFLPYTKEVCGCKSGLIRFISEILVN